MSERRRFRQNFEFTKGVRKKVRQRSNKNCEWAEGCNDRGEIFDHFTSIGISRLLNYDDGMMPEKEAIKSEDNALYLCIWHNRLKTHIEQWMYRQLKKQITL